MTLSLEEMKANRRKWVEALRSGKYRQGTDVLHRSDGSMCCLGVLCDVMGMGWKLDGDRHIVEGTQHTAVAPKAAREFVGLSDEAGAWNGGDEPALAKMNDKGASFAEIADIIESEPPGLFIDSAPTGSAS